MLLELIVNFCILFSFAVLSYWPFQDQVRFRMPFPNSHPYVIGIMAGITGFILMESAVQVTDTMIVDSRHVIIVIAGLFGGPIAPIISGVIIGLSRMLMYDVTPTSIVAGINPIILGLVIAGFSFKFPMNFNNAKNYFFYSTIQTSIFIGTLLYLDNSDYMHIVYFILFSTMSFFTLLVILDELKNHFDQIRRIELLSETDYLTGLFNNRKFHQLIKAYITHEPKPFSLISIDIDHFKKVNDIYGHPVGDEIVKELGKRLKNLVSTREGIVARNGGEQFAVLLPNAPPAMGIDMAEKIRSMVARSNFPVSGEKEIAITVSVGVSSYPDNGTTLQELNGAADAAMYEAKAIGRNRVFHYTNKKV
ncbi:MAG: diguanylate cyclase [Paenisporosarcina sp.]